MTGVTQREEKEASCREDMHKTTEFRSHTNGLTLQQRRAAALGHSCRQRDRRLQLDARPIGEKLGVREHRGSLVADQAADYGDVRRRDHHV